MRDRWQGNTSSRFLDLLVLLRHQQLVPLLGDGGRAGQVRLDHVDVPGLVRGDAVSVEEPLEIGNQETMFPGQLRDAAVEGVQAPS